MHEFGFEQSVRKLPRKNKGLSSIFRHKSMVVPWRCRPDWELCLEYVARMNFHVSHIYREGNQAADGLAPSIESSTWWNSTPTFIRKFVNDDAFGRSNFRFS